MGDLGFVLFSLLLAVPAGVVLVLIIFGKAR
jgi:hypothetical protein